MDNREGAVVPSVLTDDPAVLADRVRRLEPFAPTIQIDIMDGEFVPEKSVGAEDVARLCMRSVMEMHLMVKDPSSCLEDFARCGAGSIVFHVEPVADPGAVISAIRGLDISPGVALNPDTPVGAIKHVLPQVDMVIVMGVHPGRQGQKFIPEVLEKVRILKRLSPGLIVEVDGGMTPETGVEARRAGVDVVNVGSYLFKDGTLKENWERMEEVVSTVFPDETRGK